MSLSVLPQSLRLQLGQRAFLIACIVAPAIGAALLLAQPLPQSVRPVVLLFPVAVAIVVLTRAASRPYRFTNRLLKDRIVNLEDMFARANKSVVILSGSLNAALYSHPRVVGALKNLSPAVAVKVVYTGMSLDPKSKPFTDVLKARPDAVLLHAPAATARHAVVVDGKDTKLEEPNVRDHEEEKCADYYYDNVAVARSILGEIDALAVEPGKFPE